MGKLTDRGFAPLVDLNSLIHIVNTGDTSQSPAGSSYKAPLSDLSPLFSGATITGFTFNNLNYDLSIELSDNSVYTQNLAILASDIKVTGGTYDSNTGEIIFVNNSGGTFAVSGFLTGMTDTYTTGATLNGTILEFNRTDTTNAYSVELSGLTASVTGQSLSQTLVIGNNTGSNDIIVDSGQVIKSNTDNFLDLQNFDDNKVKLSTNGNQNVILYYAGTGKTTGSYCLLATDGENFTDSYVYLEQENYAQLARFRESDDTYYGFNLYGNNTYQQYSTGVSIKDNETNSLTSANKDNPAVIIGSRNSTINSGITNSVIIGGQNILASENNTVYVDNLNINTLGTGTSVNNLGIDSNGNVVAGDAGTFTGNTSGDCIGDIFVSNIHSCSPLNINPLDEGNVYFGSTSGFTIDVDNGGNIYTKGDYVLQTETDSSTIVSLLESGNNKGYVQLIDYTGTTGVFTLNTNTSGSTGIVFGEASGDIGFIRYHGNDFSRNAPTAVNGDDFYQNKMLISPGTTSNGTVINIAPTTNNGILWFEQDGNSPILIAGGGADDDMRLGIALNPDGTEIPTAQLQVGGTGTTGTFRYIDGNQQSGYVLTSDANGNASWQAGGSSSSKYAASIPFTGGTAQTITHNLNDTDVIVQLKDSTGKLIIPDEVNNYTLNTVDIEVSSTETYRVIIIG
jgi:hypothetical protein